MSGQARRVAVALQTIEGAYPAEAMDLRTEIADVRGQAAKYRAQLRQERGVAEADALGRLRALANSYGYQLHQVAERLDAITAECGVMLPGPALDLQRAVAGYRSAYGGRDHHGAHTPADAHPDNVGSARRDRT